MDKYKVGIIGPGNNFANSVGVQVAEKLVEEFLINPEGSGLEGIVLTGRQEDEPEDGKKKKKVSGEKDKLDRKKIESIADDLRDKIATADDRRKKDFVRRAVQKAEAESDDPVNLREAANIAESEYIPLVDNLEEFIQVGDYDDICKTDQMIICADKDGSYIDLHKAGTPPAPKDSFKDNQGLILNIAEELKKRDYRGFIGVVTNPSDYMAHLLAAKLTELCEGEEKGEERARDFTEKIWAFTPEQPRLEGLVAFYYSSAKGGPRIPRHKVAVKHYGPHDERKFTMAALSTAYIQGENQQTVADVLFKHRFEIEKELQGYATSKIQDLETTASEVGRYILYATDMIRLGYETASVSKYFKLDSNRDIIGDLLEIDAEKRAELLLGFMIEKGYGKEMDRLADDRKRDYNSRATFTDEEVEEAVKRDVNTLCIEILNEKPEDYPDEAERLAALRVEFDQRLIAPAIEMRERIFEEFINQKELDQDMKDYAIANKDVFLNLEKFLEGEKDKGVFTALPYIRNSKDTEKRLVHPRYPTRKIKGFSIDPSFELNQERWHEQIKFFFAYKRECDFRDLIIKKVIAGEPVGKLPFEPSWADKYRDAQLAIGGVQSRYVIVKEIGSGGQADVYEAIDKFSSGKRVAIKLYPQQDNPRNYKKFKKEFDAFLKLSHPNILVCHGPVRAMPESPALVFELAKEDVGKKYGIPPRKGKRTRKVPFDDLCKIMTSVSDALKETHSIVVKKKSGGKEVRLVHRDIKPNNVFVMGDGTYKLGDYGNSFLADPLLTMQASTFVGYTPYLAPEGFETDSKGRTLEENLTPMLDTYAAGAMMYHLATAIKTFEKTKDILEQKKAVLGDDGKVNGRFVDLKRIDKRLEYFDALFRKCLDPRKPEDPDNMRPKDGEELLYEVRIASNYDAVKAYETALQNASNNIKGEFKITAKDVNEVHDALAEVHKALKDIPEDKREAHIGVNFGMNLDAVVSDEANLGNSRSIFRGMTDNYKALVADCYNHIEEFAAGTRAKAESGNATAAKNMEKTERYHELMEALPNLAPKS